MRTCPVDGLIQRRGASVRAAATIHVLAAMRSDLTMSIQSEASGRGGEPVEEVVKAMELDERTDRDSMGSTPSRRDFLRISAAAAGLAGISPPGTVRAETISTAS